MFGRRSDATLVTDLSTMRRFMPFISPRRNDSVFYYRMKVEADAALAFIEDFNETQPADRQLTLFHLVLRSSALMYFDHPRVNRFVVGGRLWQRDEVWVTYSAKRELVDGAPVLTVKRRFVQNESLEEMLESILGGLRERRKGKKTTSDKEMSLAVQLPPLAIRVGMWALKVGNSLGILPKKMIDDDPLFTTLFVANVGSVGIEAGYHHLWEYGTCSAFCVMGLLKQQIGGKRIFELCFTYDERMEDGLYAGMVLQAIKERLENPEKLR